MYYVYSPLKVYRSYDNRLRCTERRPDVYEQCPIVKDDSEIILLLKDKPELSEMHAFGEPMPSSHSTKFDPKLAGLEWLWEFNGQLKVIAKPYQDRKSTRLNSSHVD